MIESKLEVLHVPETEGLSFQRLDFVVGPLDDGARNIVCEEVEQSRFVRGERLGHPFQCLYSGLHGILKPGTEEVSCLFMCGCGVRP